MILLVEVAVAVAIVFAAAALVVGRLDGLKEAPPDQAEPFLPMGRLLPADVDGARFGLVLRGYRMSEVDDVLDRLAAELTARDGELARRERELAGLRGQLAELDAQVLAASSNLAAAEAELTSVREASLEMPTAPKPYVTTSFPRLREDLDDDQEEKADVAEPAEEREVTIPAEPDHA